MATPRHLKNAPITEAVIDLRVQLRSTVKIDDIQRLHEEIRANYPNVSERNQWTSRVEMKSGKLLPPETLNLGVNGYVFESPEGADGKQVVQFQMDGFTFSRLRPYTSWDSCRTEAKKLWEIYQSLGVERVTRVATRYINHLNIPLPIKGLEEYFSGIPSAPGGKFGLVSFLNRVQILDSSRNFSAIITQALQPPKNPSVASILLDIDAFKEAGFEKPLDQVWDVFEGLRDFKDSIFFNLITDKTAELYQ